MSNVIQLRPRLRQGNAERQSRLIAVVATGRRRPDDAFWLKENAEMLGVLRLTGGVADPASLEPLALFQSQIAERMRFFPQYYRFLLSLCLDLEDLGLPGDQGTALAAWVAREGLPAAELSDLQRAEARLLLARRGISLEGTDGLDARMRAFIGRPATFAMPNQKAAYELTHIVFYLSDYGAQDPKLGRSARTSLTYCGLLAFLDQNVDLLAEVCTAMRCAGMAPPERWEALVAGAHVKIAVRPATGLGEDGFHTYLVTGWARHAAGGSAFEQDLPEGAAGFYSAPGTGGALRSLSECMFGLGAARSADWQAMRAHVLAHLGPAGHAVLLAAEQSTDLFEPFFARFARAGGGLH